MSDHITRYEVLKKAFSQFMDGRSPAVGLWQSRPTEPLRHLYLLGTSVRHHLLCLLPQRLYSMIPRYQLLSYTVLIPSFPTSLPRILDQAASLVSPVLGRRHGTNRCQACCYQAKQIFFFIRSFSFFSPMRELI